MEVIMAERDQNEYLVELTDQVLALERVLQLLEQRYHRDFAEEISQLSLTRQQLIDRRELERVRYRKLSAVAHQ
jgi:hypothetical protein